ncbi:carbon storage regulator [Bythopirellula polymerisocia]|uniref:Translational regulator CsrA n=1 Tax=Bythopirellula polymerisocia TaxID=2528003 RepID=A0A5C6CH59_9BACT|nr:carbon storage regulator [Bythopirellula polymerisocia]TWU23688.1 hypothetical protein Pla144_38630 [Bythopirellula polymerisocia]
MLVLSRKIGERIHIGEDVFVEVRRVAGNRVTLAVCAPQNVRILRGELFDAVDSFSVLDEPETSQSEAETVIMKCEPTSEPEKLPAAEAEKQPILKEFTAASI